MAKSTAYGFEYRRHLKPGQKPATLEVILADSEQVAIGEAVYLSSGYLTACPADTAMLGILVGLVTEKGENIFKTNESLDGTISGDDTYTAGSDNTTDDQVKGVVIVDQHALFQATNADSLSQAEVGLWFNGTANTNTGVDGTTGTGASYSAGTQQFQLVELITEDMDGSTVTDQGLFRIGRSQLLNDPTA
jgi:hypothetical protein